MAGPTSHLEQSAQIMRPLFGKGSLIYRQVFSDAGFSTNLYFSAEYLNALMPS